MLQEIALHSGRVGAERCGGMWSTIGGVERRSVGPPPTTGCEKGVGAERRWRGNVA